MKPASAVLVILAAIFMSISIGPAFADADDAAWIKRCVADNKDEGQSAATVASYCSCMNGKMTSSETLSITAWEKLHPAEQEACSKESGWKSK